jgi:hypothetical protein
MVGMFQRRANNLFLEWRSGHRKPHPRPISKVTSKKTTSAAAFRS